VQPGNLPADHTLLSAIKLEMFDPAGKPLTTFSPPFAVCVTYNDSDLQTAKGDSTKLIIMTDGTDGAWTELTNTTVDTTTHDVCADIGHLSQIGLFARVPAPVPSPFTNNTTLIVVVGIVLALLAVIVVVLGLVLTSRDNNKPKSGGDGYYDNPYQ
jgi:hypothetical protein